MPLTSYVSGLVVQSVPTKGVMKVDRFTADGTFTPPAGVFYAVAHIRGGGGGIGTSVGSAAQGGSSSVAFAGGTVTAEGGLHNFSVLRAPPSTTFVLRTGAGRTNSGQGAFMTSGDDTQSAAYGGGLAQDGAFIVAGGAVTPGTGIAVTVGSGGTAGTSGAAGGSGYVYIEYLA